MKIVVATLYKLGRFDGNQYDKDLKTAKVIREKMKVTSDYVDHINNNYKNAGKWLEADKKATAAMDAEREATNEARAKATAADKPAIDVRPASEGKKAKAKKAPAKTPTPPATPPAEGNEGDEDGDDPSPSRGAKVTVAADLIAAMETVEEIDAYATAEDDRKGIIAAVEERKAELAE